MRTHKAIDELILRAGAFAAAVLCMLCVIRILRTDAAASGETAVAATTAAGTTAVGTTAGSSAWEDGAIATGESPLPNMASEPTEPTAPVVDVTLPTEPTALTVSAAATMATTTARDTAALAAAFAQIPLTNDAGVSVDTDALAESIPTFEVKDEPLVLIMHTHGSESYADSTAPGETGRNEDIAKNVVRVGQALYETLIEAGIPALHDETMYDVPSYTASYSRACDGIEATLEQYPSIQIVIDVHRDAYTYADGTILATSQTFGGERMSRLMFLVGTDAGTLSHPTWRSHLALAMALQTRLEELEPGIVRPINIRRQRFNEHLTPGSLLLEVGASGDTLEEAIHAVCVFGKALAQELGAIVA